MISDNIKKWEPVAGIPHQLYLLTLLDNAKSLEIKLQGSDTDNILTLSFPSYVSYRNTDETSRLKSLNDNKILSSEWPIFKSNDTQYLDWVVEESFGISNKHNLIHYIITVGSGIIDVVASQEPQLTWEELK